MLDDAVRKRKGEKLVEEVETKIDLPVEAYLPDDYVPDSRQKVSLYKKISAVKNEGDLSELTAELKDRFGHVPEPVEMLLEIAILKQQCQQMGIDKIASARENIKVLFDLQKAKVDPQRIIKLIRQDRRLSLEPPAQLTINTTGLKGKNLIIIFRSVLEKIEAA